MIPLFTFLIQFPDSIPLFNFLNRFPYLASFLNFAIQSQCMSPAYVPLVFFFFPSLFSSTRTRTRTRTQKARWGCHSLEGDYHYTTIICTPLSSYFPGSKSSEPFIFLRAIFTRNFYDGYAYAVRVRKLPGGGSFFWQAILTTQRYFGSTRTQIARWWGHLLEGDYHYTTIYWSSFLIKCP